MTPDRFAACLPFLLTQEGGFVHDDDDPGGVTNLGVTERVWADWVGHSVTEADMRALTPAKVAPMYRARYWQAASCDKLPAGIDLAVFDFAVNGGVGRAGTMLQHVVGARPEDGHLGVQSLLAVQAFVKAMHGPRTLLAKYGAARKAFYRGCKHFDHDGAGWLARVDRVTAAALAMIPAN